MNFLSTLTNDIASRFGLGANANTLIRELLTMITGSPGGMSGFLDKIKTTGLGPEVASWLGHPDAAPLSAMQVDRALGSSTLGTIGNRVGLGATAVSTAVGYTLPKLIGALTPGGVIPAGVPSEVTNYLSASSPRFADPVARPRSDVGYREQNMTRWLWPALGAIAAIGLVSYFLSQNRPAETPTVTQRSVTTTTAALPTRLSISNEDGVLHYSGTVRNEETRTSIINAMKTAFGDKIQGDISIDPNRSATLWIASLPAALENFKTPGTQAVFDGNSVKLGGVAGDPNRDRISTALKNLFGSGVTLADK